MNVLALNCFSNWTRRFGQVGRIVQEPINRLEPAPNASRSRSPQRCSTSPATTLAPASTGCWISGDTLKTWPACRFQESRRPLLGPVVAEEGNVCRPANLVGLRSSPADQDPFAGPAVEAERRFVGLSAKRAPLPNILG